MLFYHNAEPITGSTYMNREPNLTSSTPTPPSILSVPEATISPFNLPTTKPLTTPSYTVSSQISTISREQSIMEAIETNVLQRNVKFDELPQTDNRILALNWLLDEDQMQLDPTDSNLNQRYILALLSFELGPIPNLDLGSIPENAKDSVEWLSGEDECKWWLVTCSVNGDVRVLHLDGSLEPALYLEGTLPPEIGNLNQLTNLDLQSNFLSGTLPSEIGNLNELTVLFLGSNQFRGSVPSELGNLNELIYLDLGYNMFSGSLPSELGLLKELTTLNLESNQFTGTFPWNETSKMTKLCFEYGNSFTGATPAEIECF
ncbi:hypothetical protein HJC23_007343 [Cyclotella cryptica]|uniref:Disease resistance R13L4/SHOC-2-like LRR domain-containing protein n=1 Tax=Cyclotella cryptica TaxID=29204 RepID=A0ABD3PCX2_9STRA